MSLIFSNTSWGDVMHKTKRLLIVGALATVTSTSLLLFNNCSGVKFTPAEDSIVRAIENNSLVQDDPTQNIPATDESHPPHEGNLTPTTETVASTTTATITDETTIDNLINALPSDVIESPRPVTDLIDNPMLIENYKCPDGGGIVICHFPENVDAQSTQCIGAAAVESHYNHIRTFEKEGKTGTVQDYLGPCRIGL